MFFKPGQTHRTHKYPVDEDRTNQKRENKELNIENMVPECQ